MTAFFSKLPSRDGTFYNQRWKSLAAPVPALGSGNHGSYDCADNAAPSIESYDEQIHTLRSKFGLIGLTNAHVMSAGRAGLTHWINCSQRRYILVDLFYRTFHGEERRNLLSFFLQKHKLSFFLKSLPPFFRTSLLFWLKMMKWYGRRAWKNNDYYTLAHARPCMIIFDFNV